MECPYCAEQVKDTAWVCAHCARDLTFFKPVMLRLDALEKRISSVEVGLETRPLQEEQQGLSTPSGWWKVLAVLLTTFIAVLSYQASLPEATSPTLLLISILCPWPISLLLGYMTTRKTRFAGGMAVLIQTGVPGYAALGLASGLLTFGSISFLSRVRGHKVFSSDFWPAVSIWVLGCAALFAAGGFVGRWLRKRGAYDEYSLPARIANRLVAPKSSSRNSEHRDEQVRRLATLLSALAPILTLVGSIVGGYFTYLAAVSKATK